MTINELKHSKLKAWIGEVAAMTTPDSGGSLDSRLRFGFSSAMYDCGALSSSQGSNAVSATFSCDM